jgi:acetyltransferase-like isoleucine patch superfamily enzyme
MTLGVESYSHTELRDSVKVGNYSSIAKGCIFHETTSNHLCVSNKKCVFTTNYDQMTQPKVEEIEIGHDVWIGEGVRVLPGVKIGNGAIIGAGAVVTKNVAEFAVVVGNPARISRIRFSEQQIAALNRIKWWDWDASVVRERLDDLKDIDKFIQKYDTTS